MPIRVRIAGITGWAGTVLAHGVVGTSGIAEPYVGGALLAIRRVNTIRGLRRELDAVMN